MQQLDRKTSNSRCRRCKILACAALICFCYANGSIHALELAIIRLPSSETNEDYVVKGRTVSEIYVSNYLHEVAAVASTNCVIFIDADKTVSMTKANTLLLIARNIGYYRFVFWLRDSDNPRQDCIWPFTFTPELLPVGMRHGFTKPLTHQPDP